MAPLIFVIPAGFKCHKASVQVGSYQSFIPAMKVGTKKNRKDKNRKRMNTGKAA